MNQKHLTQVWQWLSITCVLFIVGSIVSIQGGSEFVGKLFGDKVGSVADNKPAVGYFAAIIGSVLFLGACLALSLNARRHGRCWHERVPVVWLEGLKTSSWEGKLFQAVVLLLFLVLPIAGMVKCIVEAESGDICELDTNHFYKGSETTLLWPPVAIERRQMRLRREGDGNEPCKTGIEIFPRIGTPILVYGLPTVAVCGAFTALGLIFLRRRQVVEPDTPIAGDLSA